MSVITMAQVMKLTVTKSLMSSCHQTTNHPKTVIIISKVMKLTVQHDPLPPGFKEISVVKQPGEKLGMIIKGGLR